jgi:hypothetical protein
LQTQSIFIARKDARKVIQLEGQSQKRNEDVRIYLVGNTKFQERGGLGVPKLRKLTSQPRLLEIQLKVQRKCLKLAVNSWDHSNANKLRAFLSYFKFGIFPKRHDSLDIVCGYSLIYSFNEGALVKYAANSHFGCNDVLRFLCRTISKVGVGDLVRWDL